MDADSSVLSVSEQCRILGLPRSSYYKERSEVDEEKDRKCWRPPILTNLSTVFQSSPRSTAIWLLLFPSWNSFLINRIFSNLTISFLLLEISFKKKCSFLGFANLSNLDD